jgi:CHAT domain-containing protein/tetratricopeptide (TPR) repeat protein
MKEDRFSMKIYLALLLWALASLPAQAQDLETSTAALDSLTDLIALGQYDEALVRSESLVLRWEARYGPDALETARALDYLGKSLRLTGHYQDPRATTSIQRALAIKEKLLGPDHLETAVSLYGLASALGDLGNMEESIALLERCGTIRRRELGPDHVLVGDVEGSLGITLARSGRLQEARQHFERSVQITESAAGPDDPEVGVGYLNLATLYTILGDLGAAESASRRAIANIEVSRGPHHPNAAKAQLGLANILLTRGDLRAAGTALERAGEIYATLDMDDQSVMGPLWNGLGLIAQNLGDYPEAVRRFEMALAVTEQTHGPDQPELTYFLNNLGLAAQLAGNQAKAREALERSLRISQEKLGTEHDRTANTAYYLAKFELRQNNLAAAEALLVPSSSRLRRLLGSEHPQVAAAFGDLARLYELDGRFAAAEAVMDTALSLPGAAANPALHTSLEIIQARLQLRQGRFAEGCALALQADQAAAEQFRLVVQTLDENVSRRFGAVRVNGLSIALTGLLDSESPGDLVDQAWNQVILSRGMLLDELATRRRLARQSHDPETHQLFREMFTARSRLADMYVRGPGDRSPESYAQALDNARQDKRTAEAEFATHSVEFRTTREDQLVGLDQVRQALPLEAGLVAFQAFPKIGPAGEEPWYCAFVLAQGMVQVFDLGPAAVIDQLIADWRGDVVEAWVPAGPLAEAMVAANREIGTRLRELVWSPFSPLLDDLATVLIVPDGDLHLLPLSALPAAEGGYLLERGPALHYLGREKDVVRPPAPSGTGLLALGAPSFDAPLAPISAPLLAQADLADELPGVFRGSSAGCDQLATMRFTPLPATRQECLDIAALAGGQATILTEERATESAFKEDRSQPRIIHLATHGFFLGADCPDTSAGFSEDPLLLAGLALAGANQRTASRPTEEDGILTAEEIALLDLTGVEWAVLSACDTGLGLLQPGEGVYGLQRAFASAGVRTVVMSLWPIEDQATRQWMSGLYGARLGQDLTTVTAIRQAALEVLENRRKSGLSEHPFWWAGFVASGDWR